MPEYRKVAQLPEALARLKSCGPWVTNLFLSQGVLAGFEAMGSLTVIEYPGVIYVLKMEPNFSRLFFLSAGVDPLRNTLRYVVAPLSRRSVTDLLGPEQDIERLHSTFIQSGFLDYRRFVRMSRPVDTPLPRPWPEPAPAEVRRATKSEAEEVHRMIWQNFDAKAEHLPSVEDVERAASLGTVLLAFRSADIGALLWYDRAGLTTTLRYWLVLEGHRRLGMGDLLLRAYLSEAADCRRFLLWVDEKNSPAQRHYRHYGYRPDDMFDRIMMKGDTQHGGDF